MIFLAGNGWGENKEGGILIVGGMCKKGGGDRLRGCGVLRGVTSYGCNVFTVRAEGATHGVVGPLYSIVQVGSPV